MPARTSSRARPASGKTRMASTWSRTADTNLRAMSADAVLVTQSSSSLSCRSASGVKLIRPVMNGRPTYPRSEPGHPQLELLGTDRPSVRRTRQRLRCAATTPKPCRRPRPGRPIRATAELRACARQEARTSQPRRTPIRSTTHCQSTPRSWLWLTSAHHVLGGHSGDQRTHLRCLKPIGQREGR